MKESELENFLSAGVDPPNESARMNQAEDNPDPGDDDDDDEAGGHEDPADAILRSKDFANAKLENQLGSLREQLSRRNLLLGEMRTAYLRDVVVVKSEIQNRDNLRDKFSPSEALKTLPSIDLRRSLKVFAPDDCYLNIDPCVKCGGRFQLEHVQVCSI
jgi:hypothetical protein